MSASSCTVLYASLGAIYPARASSNKLLTTSMAPKEPTKHQLSARLSYSQNTPAFLRKLQSRISGIPGDDSDENLEFEDDGSGRPPIPRRPPIPERPASDPGSGNEDRDDEAPQVVVLKEGKHLSSREVENEKRKGMLGGQSRDCQIFNNFVFIPRHVQAKGLPPLPDPSLATALGDAKDSKPSDARKQDAKEKNSKGLSFSSSSSGPGLSSKSRPTTAKRKVVGGGKDGGEDGGGGGVASASKSKKVKKKPRVGLSFADDA
jgi:hypothetical protein